MHGLLVYDQAQVGSRLNMTDFLKRVQGHGPPGNFLDFNSLKSPFLGFRVIPTAYWPVPLASDEALQLESFYLLKIYLL